jgi:hypothetical protein
VFTLPIEYKDSMDFKTSDWIEHPKYGHGQISADHRDKFWKIRFVDFGEKILLKAAIQTAGHPPSPDFLFPQPGKANVGARASKKPKLLPLDFSHLLERFLAAYPGGLEGQFFDTDERQYKTEAADKFDNQLSRSELSKLIESKSFDVVANRALELLKATNLVFHIEAMRLRDGLKTNEGKKIFAEALYDHLYGTDPESERFERYLSMLGLLKASSWPIATYFHFLASRGEAMFMKPTVSQRIAESVGVALNYKPEPNWLTYSKLVETATEVRKRLADAGQEVRSGIDVQSFMWCAYEQSKK